MGWVVGVAALLAWGGYTYGGWSGAVMSFVFWFLIGVIIRAVVIAARKKPTETHRRGSE